MFCGRLPINTNPGAGPRLFRIRTIRTQKTRAGRLLLALGLVIDASGQANDDNTNKLLMLRTNYWYYCVGSYRYGVNTFGEPVRRLGGLVRSSGL